jgi:hypothetical protein
MIVDTQVEEESHIVPTIMSDSSCLSECCNLIWKSRHLPARMQIPWTLVEMQQPLVDLVTLLPSTMVHQRDLKRQPGCTIAIPLLRVTMSMVLEVDSPFQNYLFKYWVIFLCADLECSY